MNLNNVKNQNSKKARSSSEVRVLKIFAVHDFFPVSISLQIINSKQYIYSN